jgi:clathrin heavy chain
VPLSDTPEYKNSVFCFCEKMAAETSQNIHFMEIGNPAFNQQAKFKRSVDIQMPIDVQGDFPVLMQAVEKYVIVFVVTKFSYLYIYEIANSILLYCKKLTDSLIFDTTKSLSETGMVCVQVKVDERKFIPLIINYAKHIPDNFGVAFNLAQKYHLNRADELFVAQFNKLLAIGDYLNTARVDKDALGTLLTNQDTINRIEALPLTGCPQPIIIYFTTILDTSKLNEIESIQLARSVFQQGKIKGLEDWIKNNNLFFTTQLGDLIKKFNPQLAVSIYMRSETSVTPERSFRVSLRPISSIRLYLLPESQLLT